MRRIGTYFGILALGALSVFVDNAKAQPVQSARDGEIARAAEIAQCELGGPWAADLGPLPGEPKTDVRILATVSDGATEEESGVLCVGLVRVAGSGLAKLAVSNERIRLPADMTPITNYYVTIDSVPFRYSSTGTAFAVRVTEEFNSESTNYNSTELYLFRREDSRVIEIFHANVGDGLIDKTADTEKHHESIIKFSTHVQNGGYDLILSQKHGGKSERFLWTGSRYVAGKTKAPQAH